MGYDATKAWRERHPDIKAYRAEEARKWRLAHPDTWKAIKERYRSNNLEQVREKERIAQAEYRKTDRYKAAQAIRNKRFKAKQKEERLAIAGRPKPKKCEICDEDEFAIIWDHCHVHGHFRGWICDRCNRVLGLVKDSDSLLFALANYLKEDRNSFRQKASKTS